MPSDCLALDAGSALGELLGRAAESFQVGVVSEAERLCNAVLDQAPGHAGARRQLGLIRLVEGDPAGCQALLLPVRETFPNDPDLAIALAEASWATDGAATAIPHYRHALALAPGRVCARARLGLALLTAEQPAQARQELEAVTRAGPDAAAPDPSRNGPARRRGAPPSRSRADASRATGHSGSRQRLPPRPGLA